VVVLFVLLHALPYLADRVLVPRLGSVVGTLVFPLTTTGWWYLFSLVSPWGTTLNPAHTQYGDLPLLQLLSVTGVWGLVFLMAWLASVVNWAWEGEFAWPRVRGLSLAYASLLAVVVVFGGARLAFFAPQASTIRVAGISPSPALVNVLQERLSQLDLQKFNAEIAAGTTRPADRAMFREAWAPVVDDLLARSEQEARAGAKIIAWPECAVQGFQEDEGALLGRIGDFARATGTYVDVGLCQVLQAPVGSYRALDENILVDPSGSVVSRFEKAHPVPGVETSTLPGEGRLTTVETPYGRMAGVVCYDADFPALLRQAGQAGADILFVASNDWREIDPYHTQLQTFRAIEDGFSLVRQTSNGLAMTVDYEGNVLAASDYFTTDQQSMVASVPTQGVRTIYTIVGDLFAWLSLAGLVVLIGFAIVRSRTTGGKVAVSPEDDRQPAARVPAAG
jgi:apolipoprotein N-acyltransferase